MNGYQFVTEFVLLLINCIVQGFSWCFGLITAHGGALSELYWGAIVSYVVYRFLIKPALKSSGTPDSKGPGSDWSL